MWQRLETDNILLLAPRRVGKTSLLYKLEASAAQHGYRPVFVSVASHEHELAFLQALLEAVAMSTRFRRKVAGRARKLLARVIEHMLDKVGWLIPYHLQVLFSLVRDLDLARPDIEAVERAYAEMLSNHHKGYFDPWAALTKATRSRCSRSRHSIRAVRQDRSCTG